MFVATVDYEASQSRLEIANCARPRDVRSTVKKTRVVGRMLATQRAMFDGSACVVALFSQQR